MPILAPTTYYLRSLVTLSKNFNLAKIALLLFRQPQLITLPNASSYLVSKLMDVWTLKETVIDQVYEKHFTIPPASLVIDIGAAIGDFSLHAAKTAQQVVAYEPDPQRLTLLRQNIQLNQIKNIVVIPKPALSLNTVLKDVSHCDFLKIDCEGAEYQIFANANKSTLAKVRYIAMEVHTFNPVMVNSLPKLITTLTSSNFSVKLDPNPVHSTIKYLYAHKIS